MLFNSAVFLFGFLPLFLLFWWNRAIPRKTKLIGLTVASYVFYGYWDWRFTALMLLSTVVDYVAGSRIHQATGEGRRRVWLAVSLVGNLGVLGFFKYSGFLARSWNAVADWVHLGQTLPSVDVLLPVGISFYTFQSMSYSLDIHARSARPASGFWPFAAYVSMFPQLIAGPIVRYAEIEEQLRESPFPPPLERFSLGIHLFTIGLAKKLLIADVVAGRIDGYFVAGTELTLATSWLATLGYTVQLYFDFSGYSDMAVGLGHMLGFRLPKNFDSPYKSRDISEFWRRWHISLSSWLRDYLYISLGGNRNGSVRTFRNLMITMFLGGLWHGAAWTFVVWGLLHGVYLVVHNLWRSVGRPLPGPLAWALTFLAVIVGWVFFRSATFEQAFAILSAMVGANGLGSLGGGELAAFGIVALSLGVAFFAPNSGEIEFRPSRRRAILTAGVFVVCLLRLSSPSPFLYFQF